MKMIKNGGYDHTVHPSGSPPQYEEQNTHVGHRRQLRCLWQPIVPIGISLVDRSVRVAG